MFMKLISLKTIQNMLQMLDEKERRHIRKTRFPKDLENAFEMGKKIAIRAEQLD